VAKYKEKTGAYPGLHALSGYVSIYAFLEAMKKSGSTDADRVIGTLEGLTSAPLWVNWPFARPTTERCGPSGVVPSGSLPNTPSPYSGLESIRARLFLAIIGIIIKAAFFKEIRRPLKNANRYKADRLGSRRN